MCLVFRRAFAVSSALVPLVAFAALTHCGGSGSDAPGGSGTGTGGGDRADTGAGVDATTHPAPGGGGLDTGDDGADAATGDAGDAAAPFTGTPAPGDVVVSTSSLLQPIDGFGAADVFLETAMTTAQADLFFGRTSGIGLSILRVGISPTGDDYGPYADATLAAARGAIVWAAPWTPPGSSKSNGGENDGGALLAADYDAWASTIAGFAAKLKANAGVDLYGASAQNEPDFAAPYPSCQYSAATMTAFVKVLGPKLHALTPPVKLLAPEPSQWSYLWADGGMYATSLLADPVASAQVDILATHQYDNGAVVAPPASATFPQHLWETEASGTMGSTQQGPSTDMANGLAVAQWIHDALVTGGASAWHYWWLVSKNLDNEGLLLQDGAPTKRLYTVGNFSKFVRPGDRRVATSGPLPTGVEVSAYVTPGTGHVAVVALNTGSAAATFALFVDEGIATLTPWVTSASTDLVAQTALPVSNGHVMVTLPAESVTTLDGQP